MLLNSALAFGLLFVVLLTFTQFISYRRTSNLAAKEPVHPTKGRYFTRFVPEVLAEQYRAEGIPQKQDPLKRELHIFRLISHLPRTVFCLTFAYFIVQYGVVIAG